MPVRTPETRRTSIKGFEQFGLPIACKDLKMREGNSWMIHGWIAKGEVTLLSALWKVGKTTLLAHIIRCLETGTSFCGLKSTKAKILYVTEEGEHRWADRRISYKLGANVEFLVRPFKMKPSLLEWCTFIAYLSRLQVSEFKYDLLILDTISNLWPVTDENSASEVGSALMPLHEITESAAVMIVHHMRKSGGIEATGTRGSGALPSFADTILEMRRYKPKQSNDTRRVITGHGRSGDTSNNLLIKLDIKTNTYAACDPDKDINVSDVVRDIIDATGQIGVSASGILDGWPASPPPSKKRLYEILDDLSTSGSVRKNGSGKKGDAVIYYPVTN